MMRRNSAILTIACTLAAAAPVFAQAVRVTGTTVTMEPPAGFTPAARFPGFERQDVQASIMVTEVPGPASEMKRGMTKAALASRGMTLIESTAEKIDGKNALLLNVSQTSGGAEFLKWMLVAGDQKRTMMIVGTFPRAAEAELGDAIKSSLLTVRWSEPVEAPDHFEGLPFRVTSTGSLKVAGRMNNLVILNESGTMEPGGPDRALFAVGSSVSAVKIEDLRAFSEARAQQTVKTANLKIAERRAITIDGSDAYEIVGEAMDTDTGKRVTLYQVLLPGDGGYFFMQGLVSKARAATMVPEFKRVAKTFQRIVTR